MLSPLSPSFCYRYSIDRRTDMDRLFSVHPGNGSVFLLKKLDREEMAWHNISVIATEFSESSSSTAPKTYKTDNLLSGG